MNTNGTRAHAASPDVRKATAPTPDAQQATVGRVVRYVIESDNEHVPTVRAALITGVHGTKANLAVFLDGEGDYKFIEGGNAQLSAANREGALLTTLRRHGVAFDPEGTREGTWHWPARVE